MVSLSQILQTDLNTYTITLSKQDHVATVSGFNSHVWDSFALFEVDNLLGSLAQLVGVFQISSKLGVPNKLRWYSVTYAMPAASKSHPSRYLSAETIANSNPKIP